MKKIKYILVALLVSTHAFAAFITWSKPITLEKFVSDYKESTYVYDKSNGTCVTSYEKFAPIWNKEQYLKYIDKITDTQTTLKAFSFFYDNVNLEILQSDRGITFTVIQEKENYSFNFFNSKQQCEDMVSYYYK
jgi:hypothetical protein